MHLVHVFFLFFLLQSGLSKCDPEEINIRDIMTRINEYITSPVVHTIHGIENVQALIATDMMKLNTAGEVYYVKDEGRHHNYPIRAQGESIVRSYNDGEVYGGEESTLYMYQGSVAVAHQSATVYLMEYASGVFYDNVKSEAQDNANCDAYKESRVTLYGSANCRAYDTATLQFRSQSSGACHGSSKCHVFDRAVVLCYDQSEVHLYGRAHCFAYDSCKVYIYSKTAVVESRSPLVQLKYTAEVELEELTLAESQTTVVSFLVNVIYFSIFSTLILILVYRMIWSLIST